MKWNELLKKLKKAGWQKLRDAKGSHEIWHNPAVDNKTIVVANHPSQEVGSGLANKILKQAGIR